MTTLIASIRRTLIVSAAVFHAFPGATASTTTSRPSSPLDISADGSCGSGLTCLGSSWGQCCSLHGYCGDTDDYCGTGCNPAFGSCNPPSPSAPSNLCPDNPPVTSIQACRSTRTVIDTLWTVATTTYTAGGDTGEPVTSWRTLPPVTTTVVETEMITVSFFKTVTATVTTTYTSPSRTTILPTPSPTLPRAIGQCKYSLPGTNLACRFRRLTE